MDSSRPLGWGVIGASFIARYLMLESIRTQPNNTIAAVMSSDLKRARQYAAETGIPQAYDNLEAFLANPGVDIVYISTTNELHHAQTLAAAKAGKHVFCEKPLALSLEQGQEMVKACREAGVVIGVNHHLRSGAAHRTMRRLVAEGAIGQPLAVRIFYTFYLPPFLQGWRINKPEAGGGVILDITVHDADTLRFVMNDEIETVTALTAQQGLGSNGLEDGVMGVMRLRSGVLAQFHDAYTIDHANTGFEVHGTEGSLIGEGVMDLNPNARVLLKRGYQVEQVDLDEPENMYNRSVRRFVEAVRGQGQPAATGDDGLRSLAVALATQEAAKTGCSVKVRYE